MLEVISGPMFSGKTEELMRRLRRHEIGGKTVSLVKPIIDDRYDAQQVVSHSGLKADARAIEQLHEMTHINAPVGLHPAEWDVLGIDEVQFFGDPIGWLPMLLRWSVDKHVIVAGLDMDFQGKPFDTMRELMAYAHDVVKLKAVCTYSSSGSHLCGGDATNTQRMSDGKAVIDGDVVQVGGTESYEARCPIHFRRKAMTA